MKTKILLVTVFSVFSFILLAQDEKVNIENLLDQWHQAAANADQIAYFDFIAENGIYIGTDATENWTKSEFFEWSKSYFENGKAWNFEATERNIYFSKDRSIVWFDEQLQYTGGVLRGTGVLIKEKNNWKLAHYVLSLPVPNEKFKDVMKVIKEEREQSQEEKLE